MTEMFLRWQFDKNFLSNITEIYDKMYNVWIVICYVNLFIFK